MSSLQLYNEIESLPPDLRQQAEDFIAYLKTKAQPKTSLPRREFGGMRGYFIMRDDFDEPLEDFKEYMA